MAVYKIFPSKDATMYSMYPTMNTGLDEIIEATLTSIAPNDPNPQTSRYLIKFEQDEIEDVINNKISSANWQVNLRCYIAKTTGLKLDTTLDIFAVSSSWGMGTGKYLDVPLTTDGASWQFYDESGSALWDILGTLNGIPVSNSYNSTYAPLGGGTWYNQYSPNDTSTNTFLTSSQVYNYSQDKDLNVDVTNIVNVWLTGSFNYFESGLKTQQVSNDGFFS